MRAALLALGALALWTTAPAASVPPKAAHDEHCLALALYWEARAAGRPGMVPVGWVVLNRARHPEFPRSVCGVVREGTGGACQFSFWCDGRSDAPREAESWALARAVARELLTAPPRDPTRGALYFHATSVSPSWARTRERTARIGGHVYYR
jgi:spore germination cell wall hydrolase CwlJ-like protein